MSDVQPALYVYYILQINSTNSYVDFQPILLQRQVADYTRVDLVRHTACLLIYYQLITQMTIDILISLSFYYMWRDTHGLKHINHVNQTGKKAIHK